MWPLWSGLWLGNTQKLHHQQNIITTTTTFIFKVQNSPSLLLLPYHHIDNYRAKIAPMIWISRSTLEIRKNGRCQSLHGLSCTCHKNSSIGLTDEPGGIWHLPVKVKVKEGGLVFFGPIPLCAWLRPTAASPTGPYGRLILTNIHKYVCMMKR